MSPALPVGEPVPSDGSLPVSSAQGAAGRDFGVYLHVPFCAVRCGYCDFNTYTATELGGGASQRAYAATARREIELAAEVLASPGLVAAGMAARPVTTVFFGGGTPTLLPADDLASMLAAVRDAWGLVEGAEVTTEANPDSVTPDTLATLAEAGFTRVSFGMQSAVPHVLATLERTHDPARVPEAVRWARELGLQVSLDLIYGTPGESLDDWRRSVEAVLGLGVDHVSAYALVIEDGTKMAAQVRRGVLPPVDDDDQAAKYEVATEMLEHGGFSFYEVSNAARGPEFACRHNLAYWHGDDWWGIGPGAHSHVGGVRWWNVKHPRAYADRLEAGVSPAAAREVLDETTRELERIMLGVRLAEGLELAPGTGRVPEPTRASVARLLGEGLIEFAPARAGRIVLTRRGRLLADAVVRELTG